MSKTLGKILLGLYFFTFTIPQEIKGLYYIFDRVSIQILFISVLNLFIILYIIRRLNFVSFFENIKYKKHFFSYFIVLLFSLISLINADNLIEGLIFLNKYFSMFTAFLLIIYLVFITKINFIKLFFSFMILALIAETVNINYMIFDRVISEGQLLKRSMIYRGFAGNINISSFSIALKIPIVLYLLFKEKNYLNQILLSLLLSSSVLSILLLFSRAAFIAVFFIIVLSLIYYLVKEKGKVLFNSLILSLSIIISFSTYNFLNEKNSYDLIEERFNTVAQPTEDNSIAQRLLFYKIAFEDIKSSPLFGLGIGNWKLSSIQRANEILKDYTIPYVVHNDFLEIGAETGLISLTCYMYFLIFPFIISLKRSLFKKNNNLSFLIMSFLAIYLFDSLVNFPMHRVITTMNLFFIFALFYVITKNKNYESEKYF